VTRRPLALVLALTIGDYLLWNWSVNHGHDVLALISGLTLPPLIIACLWLLTLGVGRVIGRARRPSPVQYASGKAPAEALKEGDTGAAPASGTAPSPSSSSRKLAA
jgi:hypothetical protein